MKDDRNFDDLIDRFEERIYATDKGSWRLKLIKQDIDAILSLKEKLDIWDAGCGLAQVSQWLASKGHHVTLCDLSEKMLAVAKKCFNEARLDADFHHASVQTMAPKLPFFDVVIFHAVLEWLADPLPVLRTVIDKVKVGGYVSLLFYNRNAMVYSNVLKGKWRLKAVLNDDFIGQGNKLTPPNPHYPHEIVSFLERANFEIKSFTGVRVFSDYMTDEVMQKSSVEELFELEAQYCRLPTYREMGRYIHLVAKKD